MKGLKTRWKCVLAVLTLFIGAVGDDHSGMVALRAVVRSSTWISVTATPLASNLDIDGDASAGPIATVVEKSNAPYTVYLRSDNLDDERQAFDSTADLGKFFLRQSATSIGSAVGLGERIHYTLTYDGVALPLQSVAYAPATGTPITEVNVGGARPSGVNPTGGLGITKSLNIVIQPNQQFSAGIYSDTLTLIISPDTTSI